MIDPSKIISKLRRPPAAHNFVKSVKARRDQTAFALHNFALFPPRSSLKDATAICGQIVYDGIDLEQALKCVSRIKKPSDRVKAHWIVSAFHREARRRGWKGIEVFRDTEVFFRVSPFVNVPVRPSFVLNEDGVLIPYFLICWAKMDFTQEQKALLSTLISETILSLEEFEGSDAVIICTPLACSSKFEREVRTWRVSAFPPLSEEERQRVFERYARALDDAEKMIIESLS
jgi:hypothetical protein